MRVCLAAAFAFVCSLQIQISALAEQTPTTISVGVERGTVIVASAHTPEILARFIAAAGGADSPIVFVPTASLQKPGAPALFLTSNSDPTAALKAAGAKNVVVLHTLDRNVANSDSFAEPITRAAGVWFGGGMPEYLLDTYAGTKAEVELKNVLARGGVVGGISAGAMILAGDTVNGSLSADRQWVMRKGFGLLRGVAFQPHAQTPKPDSWMLKRPDLLRIAADNSTAWLVVGDVAEIIGAGNAYVYEETGRAGDPRSITLRPGDRYDLAARVIRRTDRQ
jgi:cyanophycinase